eukprot:COSAG05_NODE_4692_length_1407_cov_1.705657_2_plen_107_part_01
MQKRESIVVFGKHRTKADMEPKTEAGQKGREILQKTVEIIAYFQEKNPGECCILPLTLGFRVFYVENPRGLMRYDECLKALPPHRIVAVCYCKYGFDYQKHTDIFTN